MADANGRDSLLSGSTSQTSSVDGSALKPRRSLVHMDVVSQLQAEDLSKTGTQQEPGPCSDQFWHSTWNSSRSPAHQLARDSSHRNAISVKTGRPAAFHYTNVEVPNLAESPYWSMESWRGNENEAVVRPRPSTAESASSTFSSSTEPFWFGGQRVVHSTDDIDDWLVQPAQKSTDHSVMTDKSLAGQLHFSLPHVHTSSPLVYSKHLRVTV